MEKLKRCVDKIRFPEGGRLFVPSNQSANRAISSLTATAPAFEGSVAGMLIFRLSLHQGTTKKITLLDKFQPFPHQHFPLNFFRHN